MTEEVFLYKGSMLYKTRAPWSRDLFLLQITFPVMKIHSVFRRCDATSAQNIFKPYNDLMVETLFDLPHMFLLHEA